MRQAPFCDCNRSVRFTKFSSVRTRHFVCDVRDTKYEPAQEIMVLITKATSEGSGEPAHPHNLARAFAVRTHEVWK